MVSLGQLFTLRVVRLATPGAYLDGENLGEILLPGQFVKPGTIPGEAVEVFVHRDSDDRIVATTEKPFAFVGDFAYLRVVASHPAGGVFLDWGIGKDLYLPRREIQGLQSEVQPGRWVVVRILIDPKSDRIVASMRLQRYLNQFEPLYARGQKVSLLVYDRTELGFKVIVDGSHSGLLYLSELKQPVAIGEKHEGFVALLRSDGKLDVALGKPGYERVAPLRDRILEALVEAGGTLALSDKSPPEAIEERFNCSKRDFKQAIGALYKERLIDLTKFAIKLAK